MVVVVKGSAGSKSAMREMEEWQVCMEVVVCGMLIPQPPEHHLMTPHTSSSRQQQQQEALGQQGAAAARTRKLCPAPPPPTPTHHSSQHPQNVPVHAKTPTLHWHGGVGGWAHEGCNQWGCNARIPASARRCSGTTSTAPPAHRLPCLPPSDRVVRAVGDGLGDSLAWFRGAWASTCLGARTAISRAPAAPNRCRAI